MGPLEDLDMCLKHLGEHTEVAPDSSLASRKDEKLVEEVCERK